MWIKPQGFSFFLNLDKINHFSLSFKLPQAQFPFLCLQNMQLQRLLFYSLFLIILFIPVLYSYGQEAKRIELLNADVSEFDQDVNPRATRLIGNVKFKHENVLMSCDSAYLYREDNQMEAHHHNNDGRCLT